MVNTFYKNRYDKFINHILSLGDRNLSDYTEIHHIKPRCLKGDDSRSNLIELTLREHFLAHWLLWKTYPHYLPIASAFLQMNNKNSKLSHKPNQGRITSRVYEELKKSVYKKLSEINSGHVYVKNQQGETVKLSKEEYQNQNEFKFHTNGMIYVLDTETNLWKYITSDLYQNNKDRYKSRMSLNVMNGNDIRSIKYRFIDIETDEVIMLSKSDARALNKNHGYKRFKQQIKHRVTCLDANSDKFTININDYNPDIHHHINANRFSVYDTLEGKNKIVSIEEYHQNIGRYKTSTKGKVLAKDEFGNNVLVSKEEFKSGNYIGQTKGFCTVKDRTTGEFVQVSKQEFKNNPDRYVGPNEGKANVIDKLTGKRMQISKSEFDTERYVGLGNKKYLFKCKNKLTNKEKFVNIYEWDLLKNQYEILDLNKFNRAKEIKEKN